MCTGTGLRAIDSPQPECASSPHEWPGRAKDGNLAHHLNSSGTDHRITYDKPLRCEGVYRSHILLHSASAASASWSGMPFDTSTRARVRPRLRHPHRREAHGHANIALTYSTYTHPFPNHQDMSRPDSLDAVTACTAHCASATNPRPALSRPGCQRTGVRSARAHYTRMCVSLPDILYTFTMHTHPGSFTGQEPDSGKVLELCRVVCVHSKHGTEPAPHHPRHAPRRARGR